LKPVLDRFDGEEASDDPRDGFVTGMSLAGGSGIVVTLPCLECPPRERVRLGESVFGMLRLCGPTVGPSDGVLPKFVRDAGRDVVLLFLVDENEASLTGDTGRCCAYAAPEVEGVPRRGTDGLGNVDTTEPEVEATALGLAVD
jgi:hypothetical protein